MSDQRIQEIRARQEAAQLFLLKCDRTNLGCQVPQAVKLVDDDIPYLINLVESLQRQQEQQEPKPILAYDALEKDNELGYVSICIYCGQRMYGTNHNFCSGCGKPITFDEDYAEDLEEFPPLLVGSVQIGQVVTGKIVAADAEQGTVSIKWQPIATEPKGDAKP